MKVTPSASSASCAGLRLHGVESLVSQPFSMPRSRWRNAGERYHTAADPPVGGIEDPNDLIADWQQALRRSDYSDARVVVSASAIPAEGGR